jgi:hypothetical protein
MRKLASVAWCVVLYGLSSAASAESMLPFGKEWAGDRELPRPYGFGVDVFTLDQEYEIESLSFTLPGVTLPDPSVIGVDNDVQHMDFRADVWLLPFLNVYAVYGYVRADTIVNLGRVPLPQLGGANIGTLVIDYTGQVYGAGVTLAYGGERWFTSLSGTYAEAHLDGDFDSSVESTTWQPRVGLVRDQWQFWLGGYYVDTEEEHRGVVTIPALGSVPFEVVLGERDKFNPSLGARYAFTEYLDMTVEFGAGDRDTTLFNLTYRSD